MCHCCGQEELLTDTWWKRSERFLSAFLGFFGEFAQGKATFFPHVTSFLHCSRLYIFPRHYPWTSRRPPARANHRVASPDSAIWSCSVFSCVGLWSLAGHPQGQKWVLFSLGLCVCTRVQLPAREWVHLVLRSGHVKGSRVHFVTTISSFWLMVWEI